MSANLQVEVEGRNYSGWLNPRYPIGYWQGSIELAGDATGGILSLDLVFQSALAARLDSQIYSVERLSFRTSDGVARGIKLTALNMGGPSNLGFAHEYTIATAVQDGVAQSAVLAREMSILPWFLGSQRTAGITASLSIVTDNVNSIAFKLEAEGYRWSSRSILVDGGPQRPPTGPYGR